MRDEGDDWFGIDLRGVARTRLVFSDGQGRQTIDLERDRDGWFIDGQWFEQPPAAATAATSAALPVAVVDWTRIDPRLESPGATYQDLIDQAHARGLRIVQDVVGTTQTCSA